MWFRLPRKYSEASKLIYADAGIAGDKKNIGTIGALRSARMKEGARGAPPAPPARALLRGAQRECIMVLVVERADDYPHKPYPATRRFIAHPDYIIGKTEQRITAVLNHGSVGRQFSVALSPKRMARYLHPFVWGERRFLIAASALFLPFSRTASPPAAGTMLSGRPAKAKYETKFRLLMEIILSDQISLTYSRILYKLINKQ